MALRSDTEGFLIGDPLDMGAALDLWRDVRDDTRAILGMLRKRQGGAEPAPDIRGREVGREAVVPGRRADRPAAPIRSVEAPVSRPGRAESSRETPSPAETPRRALGAGAETRQTNALLGRLIRRVDGHDQRLTKSLKAIERAIEDLAEVSRQSGARAAAGGSGGGLPGWAAGAGAAIAGWLGLKKGGGFVKSLTGGTRNLLGRMPVGRMGGPIGAVLGGVGLISAWNSANADESLTSRQRATRKGRAVGEFGGLMGGMAAGAAAGSLLGPVGTVVGGLIGGALGAWGGGKAGEAITDQAVDFADTETGMQIAQQWTSTTAALRGRWDALVTRGTETFAGMGAKWDSAVEQIQGWFAEASGALSRFAEQANTWVKDKTGIDVKAEAQNAADAIASGAARANAWVEDKTGVDVGESVKRGVDATTEAVRSGFDRLINLVRPSAAAGDDGSASVAIDDAKLTADLGSGGALRHTATASTTAGAASDVPTLGQATEASALAAADGGNGIARVIESGKGYNIVERADGSQVKQTGARNWRNNNPGNIEYGEFARSQGAIGTDGRFAVFPSYEAGRKAKSSLIFEGKNYRDKTLEQAISRYAPPSENDTGWYQREVLKAVGGQSKRMSDYTPAEREAIMDAMERVEGFRAGRTETVRAATRPTATVAGASESELPATPTGSQATQSVVRRVNQNATRNKDITPELEARVHEAVRAVYGDGARADLYSGGQDRKGQGTRRTGSTRHDDGKAGDFYIYGADGKQIKGDELGKLGQYWTAKNYGSVGMEMRGGGVHLDEHTDRAKSWGYEKDGGRYTKAQRAAIARGLQGELPELKLDPSVAALPGKATSATTARPVQTAAQATEPAGKAATAPPSSEKPLDPVSKSFATMMSKIPGTSDSWREAASAGTPGVTPSSGAMDALLSTGGNSTRAALGALVQGPRGLPMRPPPSPRDALKGMARAAVPDLAGMFGQVAHGGLGALAMMPQQAMGALSVVPPIPSLPTAMPIPSPAAAPSIPEPATSPRGQGAGERKDDNRPMRNVGQDVRDRRIAHIVTGGIGAAL